MPKPARAAKDTRKPWKSFPPEAYEKAVAGLIHFTAKAVNSNASPATIRLSHDKGLRLPYVAVRTMGPSLVPLDFSGNAGDTGAASQVLAVLENEVDVRFTDAPVAELEAIRQIATGLKDGKTAGGEHVDPRLRQLLMQDGSTEGGYVSITPLPSAGLSVLIDKRVRAERERETADKVERKSYRSVANMPIGGSNPQNIGLRVRSMGNPLVFSAPKENPETRRAYSIHFRGVSLKPSQPVLDKFYKWRKHTMSLDAQDREVIASNIRVRKAESAVLRRMVHDLASRIENARNCLQEAGLDPSSHLDPLVRGALSPEVRDQEWIRGTAEVIARAIARHKGNGGVPLSDSEADSLRPEIEQAIREYL